MTHLWLGCTADGNRDELERALGQVDPRGHLVFAQDAADLRCRLRDEEPGTVGAIVGLSAHGVYDVNLAAAIASDGMASEVVLVARFVTGSLRSRAAQAGVTKVIDIDDVLFDELANGDDAVELPKPAAEPEDDAPQAPIIVFASGRGGVGKTALCALSAVVAAHWGLRVAVCDLDLSCGNLPSCFGVGRWRDPATLVHDGVLDGTAAMAAGTPALEGVTLWGPCERPEMAEQVMPGTGNLLFILTKAYDLVLVDTSSTCTDAVAQAMQLSDRLVLVHDSGPDGVTSLARTSALAVRLGVARTRIMRVENGCPTRLIGAPSSPRVEVGLEAARLYRVPDGGGEVGELLAAGQVGELYRLGGEVVSNVSVLLASALRELGRLPENEEAQKFAEQPRRRRGLQLFGRKREVA